MTTRAVYRNYEEFRLLVVRTLAKMIERTKGNMLTFNSKKIAILAGIDTHPVILTLIKDVLEGLRKKGYIKTMGRSKHGTKYMINSKSPLWILAKHGEEITSEALMNIEVVVAKINKRRTI
ncbi:MAG: hypothetical protein DRJ35_01620 [Thermoprotei archaeon]|nr:MAG: hypothetical protein DRJ35_01620 [Thermoprotei archaeon]